MATKSMPKYMRDRTFSHEQALAECVKSGEFIGSGFATSEPHSFYDALWDHIQKNDLTDINIRQALFMSPHRLLIGDALEAKGLLNGLADHVKSFSLISNLARRLNLLTQKVEGLNKLVEHLRELQERRITFVSAFLGPTCNMIIPSNPLTRSLYSEFAGRNKSRMGIVDMQSVHFPDAPDSMAYNNNGNPILTTVVAVMTPPNEKGEMSHGIANGANHEMLELAFESEKMKILLYINDRYPFTYGHKDLHNTMSVRRFKRAADQGRLFVVMDNGKLPALPKDSFVDPPEIERRIAENVVNHMELNKELTYGRAIQVGFGGTGVLAIRGLRQSSWKGRMYTEMLEPFTMDLFENGQIEGTHYIERDGRRKQLDGKMICTFSICEENSDFYDKLDGNPDVYFGASSRIVIPEAFNYGLGINNVLSIDFHGHVNSGGRDSNHYSGIGGAATIVRGLSKGGVSYLCMKSTHRTPNGEQRSSIFPYMPQGTPISLIGPDLMGTREGAKTFLVTEHGVTRINAMTQSNFIKNIISVADPDFQYWLKKRAFEEFRVKI